MPRKYNANTLLNPILEANAPMNSNEIAEIVLQFIEVLTRWQLVILYISLIFRKPISNAIPALMSALANRATRISGPGFSVDLASQAYKFEPELIGEIVRKASSAPIETEDIEDAEEFPSELEIDHAYEAQPSEIDELERAFRDIKTE